MPYWEQSRPEVFRNMGPSRVSGSSSYSGSQRDNTHIKQQKLNRVTGMDARTRIITKIREKETRVHEATSKIARDKLAEKIYKQGLKKKSNPSHYPHHPHDTGMHP